jgi:hypothetical protein
VLNSIGRNLQSVRETQNNNTKIRLARNNLTSLRKFSNNFVVSFENTRLLIRRSWVQVPIYLFLHNYLYLNFIYEKGMG